MKMGSSYICMQHLQLTITYLSTFTV